jgi:twinkle protein
MNTIPPRDDFTNQELQAIFAKAESNSVRSIGEFHDAVIESITNPQQIHGVKLPWGKTHGLVRLRTSEVSIWAGINGHRKSTLLNQVALWATRQAPVGIASLEMPVEGLAKLMVSQASGAINPTAEYATQVIQKLSRRMWFYDRLGSVPPLEILGAVHALSQVGCKLIVIDSLTMCRVTDDMERERLFMAELTSLAKALDIHVALVHHVRKPAQGGDEYVPSRFDVKGSGSIVDLTQNLFICWANKARATALRKINNGIAISAKEQEIIDTEPDQKLIVAKQRHAEYEGAIHLWHHPSRQFVGDSSGKPIRLDSSD